MESKRHLLYHEPQVLSLCGVHCLNTLLQGPYFTEVELASIAHRLDEEEREMLGMDYHYTENIDKASANAAADGNFSIQVLSLALGVFGLTCTNIDSPDVHDVVANFQKEEGYLCHLENHWFTIRKVDAEWYNLNSLFPAPEHLSHFYLSAFLATLKASGWTIFVVRGTFPRLSEMAVVGVDGSGKWWTPAEAAVRTTEKIQSTNRGREAVHFTNERSNEQSSVGFAPSDVRQRDQKFDWSSAGRGRSLQSAEVTVVKERQTSDDSRMTGSSTPQPKDAAMEEDHESTPCQLAIRLPDGRRIVGNFSSNSTLKDIFAFLDGRGVQTRGFSLCPAHPGAQILCDLSSSLLNMSISDKSTLILRKTVRKA